VGWLTDTHCHLNLNIFQDRLEPVLERAWERGISRILVPGIDVATSRAAVALAERYDNLYAAVGVHPGDASTWQASTASRANAPLNAASTASRANAPLNAASTASRANAPLNAASTASRANAPLNAASTASRANAPLNAASTASRANAPLDAASTAGTLAEIRELARHPKVVAIGEIGLDYYRDHSPRPLQRQVFHEQLELAAELGLPVVIHNRESIEDVWSELAAWQDGLVRSGSALAEHPGVLHSFDGTLETARQVIAKGFFIGISGPVTFKNAHERQELVSALPLSHLLVETDAPFLTPHPYRGKWPNEPAYVAFVAEKIAELHSLPLETVTRATWENAAQVFHWGAIS
jgi:TatD DNase family protein